MYISKTSTATSLLTLIPAVVSNHYQLDTEYSGAEFFDGWNFFSDVDPTNGFVTYVDRTTSINNGLISTANEVAYMGVDNTTVLESDGPGRNSVRITTEKTWTHGLFIGDIAHMPDSTCGIWPAFWSFGPDWPNDGEVDIIEGVNYQKTNQMSAHTTANCAISGSKFQDSTFEFADCATTEDSSPGCSFASTSSQSYGTSFNRAGGGVYAMEWTPAHIRIWFFSRSEIPWDIILGLPYPPSWGLPQANFEGPCDIDDHFREHSLVFDTTFCGDWAANDWDETECSTRAESCVEFVAENPEAFVNSYWEINSVRVYKLAAHQSSSKNSTSGSAPDAEQMPTSVSSFSASLLSTQTVTEIATEPTAIINTTATPGAILAPATRGPTSTSASGFQTLPFNKPSPNPQYPSSQHSCIQLTSTGIVLDLELTPHLGNCTSATQLSNLIRSNTTSIAGVTSFGAALPTERPALVHVGTNVSASGTSTNRSKAPKKIYEETGLENSATFGFVRSSATVTAAAIAVATFCLCALLL